MKKQSVWHSCQYPFGEIFRFIISCLQIIEYSSNISGALISKKNSLLLKGYGNFKSAFPEDPC